MINELWEDKFARLIKGDYAEFQDFVASDETREVLKFIMHKHLFNLSITVNGESESSVTNSPKYGEVKHRAYSFDLITPRTYVYDTKKLAALNEPYFYDIDNMIFGLLKKAVLDEGFPLRSLSQRTDGAQTINEDYKTDGLYAVIRWYPELSLFNTFEDDANLLRVKLRLTISDDPLINKTIDEINVLNKLVEENESDGVYE